MKPWSGSPKYYQTRLDVLRIFRLYGPFYASRLFGCLNIFYCFLHYHCTLAYVNFVWQCFIGRDLLSLVNHASGTFCYSRLHFTLLCICLATEEGLTTLVLSRLSRKGMVEVQIFHGILFEDAQKHCKNVGSQKLCR